MASHGPPLVETSSSSARCCGENAFRLQASNKESTMKIKTHTRANLTRKETRADRASKASLMLESADMIASEEDQAPCFLVRS